MPKQIRGINLIDNGETVTVEIGMIGREIVKSFLFDRQLDQEQIRENIRLAFQIGGYSHPASSEFVDYVVAHGIEGKDKKYYVRDVVLEEEDGQVYRVYIGDKRGSEILGIPVALSFLMTDQTEDTTIISNVATWLRKNGKTDLDSDTIQQLKSVEFWR